LAMARISEFGTKGPISTKIDLKSHDVES